MDLTTEIDAKTKRFEELKAGIDAMDKQTNALVDDYKNKRGTLLTEAIEVQGQLKLLAELQNKSKTPEPVKA